MANIVFTDCYTACGVDLSALETLGNLTCYDFTEPSQTVDHCRDAEIVIANKTRFSAAVLQQLPRLKMIAVAATGTNNVDMDAAEKQGVKVTNVTGYAADAVAEATFAAVLALMRNTVFYDNYVKSGDYASSGRIFCLARGSHELRGKTWGIIGLGSIGTRVAEIATAFGARVVHFSPSGRAHDTPYRQTDLETLLRESDVVSIHAPLTDRTDNMLDYKQICMMKPGAILCNMARGRIVNEAALARALNENRIAGAASDVFSAEPITPDNPLLGVEDPYKLVLAPHSAWATEESSARLFAGVVENVRNFLKDNPGI